MSTRFVLSPDHICIAYDVSGAGTPILLLHGGGGSRADWHTQGYVARLAKEFRVIPVDLRGHGESERPTDRVSYSTEKMGQDILAVADACNAERFILCGFSFGGNVGRYLAACSNRVSKLIMLGNRIGPGVSAEFRLFIHDFRARWSPVVQAAGNVFDPDRLSEKDQDDIRQLSFPGKLLPAVLAWSTAMLDWGTVTPADLHCPTLWLIGSENDTAMQSLKNYREQIHDLQIQVRIIEGLNHEQEFENIEQVLPAILDFVRS